MDFYAIGKALLEAHIKFAASLLDHSKLVVVHTSHPVDGKIKVTQTNVEKINDGVPPVLRSVTDYSPDLKSEVEFFMSTSLKGVDPKLVYEEIIKIEKYQDLVKINGNTVYLSQ